MLLRTRRPSEPSLSPLTASWLHADARPISSNVPSHPISPLFSSSFASLVRLDQPAWRRPACCGSLDHLAVRSALGPPTFAQRLSGRGSSVIPRPGPADPSADARASGDRLVLSFRSPGRACCCLSFRAEAGVRDELNRARRRPWACAALAGRIDDAARALHFSPAAPSKGQEGAATDRLASNSHPSSPSYLSPRPESSQVRFRSVFSTRFQAAFGEQPHSTPREMEHPRLMRAAPSASIANDVRAAPQDVQGRRLPGGRQAPGDRREGPQDA
jgi:hypothetical protein